MGRRGTCPDHDKSEAFARLIAEGIPSARASRIVGVNPRTGKRWRNGRRLASGGRVLDLAPVITTPPTKQLLAALPVRGRARAPRRPAPRGAHRARDRRADDTLPIDDQPRARGAGADDAGRYRPFEAHRRALGAAACAVPAACPGTPCCATGSRAGSRPTGARSRSPAGCATSFPTSPERWLCAETIYQAVYRPDLGGLPRELPGRVLRLRRRRRPRRRDAQARRSGPVAGMTADRRATGRGPRARAAGALGGRPDRGHGARVRDRHAWSSAPRGTPCWATCPAPAATPRPCATPSSRPSAACRPPAPDPRLGPGRRDGRHWPTRRDADTRLTGAMELGIPRRRQAHRGAVAVDVEHNRAMEQPVEHHRDDHRVSGDAASGRDAEVRVRITEHAGSAGPVGGSRNYGT